MLRRAVLPLVAVASAAGGAVGYAELGPGGNSNPFVEAEVICPADTDLAVTETHMLLSKAAVKVSCEDSSDRFVAPLTEGYPGTRNLNPGIKAAPPSALYVTYKPEKDGKRPEISWSGGRSYEILELVGASSVVDVSFKKP